MRILLSIKPEYAEKILNGTKRFEYRKAVPRNELVRTVVIYATMPIGKVVGEFEIAGMLCEKPNDLWERTKSASGITRKFFDSYFGGRDRAMAIVVKRPKRYAAPKHLMDVSGSLTPPQSFQYLTAEREVRSVPNTGMPRRPALARATLNHWERESGRNVLSGLKHLELMPKLPPMPGDVLTLPEAARSLKVAESAVYVMAKKGQLSAFKIGRQWRFKRRALDQWVKDQKTTFRDDQSRRDM